MKFYKMEEKELQNYIAHISTGFWNLPGVRYGAVPQWRLD